MPTVSVTIAPEAFGVRLTDVGSHQMLSGWHCYWCSHNSAISVAYFAVQFSSLGLSWQDPALQLAQKSQVRRLLYRTHWASFLIHQDCKCGSSWGTALSWEVRKARVSPSHQSLSATSESLSKLETQALLKERPFAGQDLSALCLRCLPRDEINHTLDVPVSVHWIWRSLDSQVRRRHLQCTWQALAEVNPTSMRYLIFFYSFNLATVNNPRTH